MSKPYFCSCYKSVSSNDVIEPTTVIINDELNISSHNENLSHNSDKELYHTKSESNNNQCMGMGLSFFNLFVCCKNI